MLPNVQTVTVSVLSGTVSDFPIVRIYRSKSKVSLNKFIHALNVLDNVIPDCNTPTVNLGDFDINLF